MRQMLQRHKRSVAVLLGLALIALTGLVHGLWSNRWSQSEALGQACSRLEKLSMTLGAWKSRAQTISEDRLTQAEIQGYARRFFTHPEHSQPIGMLIMCGVPGPVSVHTPQYCYSGAGYTMVGEPMKIEIPLQDKSIAKVFTARFYKPQAPGSPPLRIFWTWSVGEGWEAPSMPRWTFRRASALFKVYVMREMTSLDEPLLEDPCITFMKEVFPLMDRELFPASAEK